MSTQTLEFKIKEKQPDHDLEVEIDSYGNIHSIMAYVPILDLWMDCREKIENDPIWKKRIEEKFSELEWPVRRDDDEVLRDYLATIKEGLKPA